MQKSLFSKFFTVCLSIILASISILGVVLLVFASQYFKNDKFDLLSRNVVQAVAITSNVTTQGEGGYYVDSTRAMSGYSILGNAIDADIFLVDQYGKTLICTHRASCIHTTYMISEKIMEEAREGEYREMGSLGGIYSEPYYTVGRPIKAQDGSVIGVVFASTSAEGMTSFLLEIFKMFLFSAIAVLALSFIVIYFVTDRLVRPLREMADATQSFSKGDFAVRVPVEGYDEVSKLAMAFNTMASSLAAQDQTSRSFIANVSHELKTPMTTISGFIDGILDGTIPEEKQRHYLTIVSEEVKRLSRLIKSMLNIAKIEAGEMVIKPVPVDINDIVCRTVFTFEKAIEEKRLDIRGLDVDKIMVEADPDLIHQVVYNLIDNAVKFVNEGGYIEFSYTVDTAMTYIGVKNSGQGLTKEEVPRVFDRFYKTDKSRSLDKNGVGLGLHIVRSIINLHSGDIMVRSVEGEYCEFVFSLPTLHQNNGQSIFRKGEKGK